MNGVHIHANIIDSILNQRFVKKCYSLIEYVLAILLIYFNLCFFLKLKNRFPVSHKIQIRLLQLLELMMLFFFTLLVYNLFRLRISIDIFILSILLYKETYEIINEEVIPFGKLVKQKLSNETHI